MMWSYKFCFKPWNVVYFLQETKETNIEEEEEKHKIIVFNVLYLDLLFLKFNLI